MMAQVYLAVGHGVRPDGTFDPGAVDGDATEQTEGDPIVDEATRVLRGLGVEVVEEAYDDDPNYVGTTEAVNAGDYDCVVSVHHDWSGAPRGGFGLYVSDAGKALADAIAARWPFAQRDNQYRDDLYLLKQTHPPAVIWEADRVADYPDEENRDKGRAIAYGIADWLGVRIEMPEATWEKPGDPVLTIEDAEKVIQYQGSIIRQVDFDFWGDADKRVIFARVIDVLMQHNNRVSRLAGRVNELEDEVVVLGTDLSKEIGNVKNEMRLSIESIKEGLREAGS